MSEGLDISLADAFAEAESELGEAEPSEPVEGMPPEDEEESDDGDQAPAEEATEQPEAGTEVDDLLGQLETEEPTLPVIGTSEFWETVVDVEVDGVTQRMTLGDLRGGMLMQADYTRKTQDLAREREFTREAVDFHQAFRDDPQGFAQYLAAKAGLIEDDGETPTSEIKVYTADQVEQMVTEKLEAALEQHPDVLAARDQQGITAVEAVFTELEAEYGSLSRDNKIRVLQEAQRRGTADVRLVFEALLLQASRQAQARQNARQAAPSKPGKAPTEEPSAEPTVKTVEDALRLAEQELAGSVA